MLFRSLRTKLLVAEAGIVLLDNQKLRPEVDEPHRRHDDDGEQKEREAELPQGETPRPHVRPRPRDQVRDYFCSFHHTGVKFGAPGREAGGTSTLNSDASFFFTPLFAAKRLSFVTTKPLAAPGPAA